jgi:hypothetical protein
MRSIILCISEYEKLKTMIFILIYKFVCNKILLTKKTLTYTSVIRENFKV